MKRLQKVSAKYRSGRKLAFERFEERILLTTTALSGADDGFVCDNHKEAFERSEIPCYAANEVVFSMRQGDWAALASELAGLLSESGNDHAVVSVLPDSEFSDGVGDSHLLTAVDINVARVVQQLEKLDAIVFAEPNYHVSIGLFPDDSQFSDLWGMHNTGQTSGTDDADIDAPEAWEVETGTHQIVVGVIDTGVDYSHPDLYQNIWINQDEIPAEIKNQLVDVDADGLYTFIDLNSSSNWDTQDPSSLVSDINGNNYIDAGDLLGDTAWSDGTDTDNNGYIDDLFGWDFVNGDNDPYDDNDHGTHVSGTIGAMGDNGEGVVGVNWDIQIMGLKFLDVNGGGYISDAVSALDYAVAEGAVLTNNSWGGGGYSQAMYDAISQSGQSNQLFIAAAGNDNNDNDQLASYPASYDLGNVVSVAATDKDDQYAGFSSFGSSTVDLAAPGSAIISTTPDGLYESFSGTSMAAPHVSGAAALIWSADPSLTNDDVKQALMDHVDSLGSTSKETLTNGRLNVFRAMSSLEDDEVAPGDVSDLSSSAETLSSVTKTWTATGDDGTVGTATVYDIRYSIDSAITVSNWDNATQLVGEPQPQVSGAVESFEVSGLLPATTYHFGLRVRSFK